MNINVPNLFMFRFLYICFKLFHVIVFNVPEKQMKIKMLEYEKGRNNSNFQ